MPINHAFLGGNGNAQNQRRQQKIKSQTNLDRHMHGPRPIPIISHLPYHASFSLPSTFKVIQIFKVILCFKSTKTTLLLVSLLFLRLLQ